MRNVWFAAAVMLATAVPVRAQSTWEIDPAHSSVGFSIRHMMVSNVRGTFGKFSGMAKANEKDLTESTVEATIDVASIDTGNAKRDDHLRSPDFFDVAKYPTITFKSRKVTPAGDKKWKVTGDLTMHGVTKEVTLDVEGPTAEVKDPQGKVRAGATVTTKLNRSDFGITWSKTLDGGGLVLGEEVGVTIDVEGVKTGG
jgi:polyisoprenoid-binding protein YceI